MRVIDNPDRGIIHLSAISRGTPLHGMACYGLWVSGVVGSGRPIGTLPPIPVWGDDPRPPVPGPEEP